VARVENAGVKFAWFVLGIALPVAGYFVWLKTEGFGLFSRKAHVDKMHDMTVEDSFPASDPPSAW
jgi:hypothetical protein